MNKPGFVIRAVLCVALGTPVAVCGADDPQSEDGSQSAELARLKAQLEQQQKQIEALQQALTEQQKVVNKAVATTAGGAAAPAPPAATQDIPESPLQVHIGDATFTPVGFVDVTNTFRSTNSGANLATNFGSIPYNNTVGGRLTEDKMSLQNSRVGMRVDANFKSYHLLGYWESDFVGAAAANNLATTSNSVLFRLRLFWIDVRKSKYEFLAGQSWSMMTPNRRQISPLPGDLFYGQAFDVNYLNGLTWARNPGFRFVYHPSEKVTWGIAAENSTQYFGGSGGGGVPTLPAALASLSSNQIDANAANDYTLPNVMPDIISKLAFDPTPRVHFEFAGVLDHSKIWNPNSAPALGGGQYFTTTGGGGSFNANVAILKNFRLITNNFWSDGAGRYLFGVAPNFIVRSNGSLSNVHSGSTLDGFEWTLGKSLFYVYYGTVFVGRNTALDANGTTSIGYGYRGSPNSQNRTTEEITGGVTQTLFRDPRYGQVSFYLQYAYFWRAPWYVAPNAPKDAFQNAAWFNFRYTLPGAAPAIEY
ncbi:MAG TPA: hypothetical protein VH640_07330 [Bryobacteraceae bacterium]|jgi:hypothetical protein